MAPRAALPALLCLALLVAAPGARAVIVASGDGTHNTTAPPDDPGWANLGRRGSLGAIYLGNGWVLTAAHVGAGTVTFDGVAYEPIPGSVTTFETAPGEPADLIAFRLAGAPALPALEIAATPPLIGDEVVMAGWGRNRGAATTWNGIGGWLWGTGNAKRWGTNQIDATGLDVTVGSRTTRSLETSFSDWPPPAVTTDEAQAAVGDSGGALYWSDGGSWRLAGVIYSVGAFAGQPASTALFGNTTFSVDLSHYRAAILAVIEQPECSNGLDDDGDGLTDFPADPACRGATGSSESSLCQDGIDNDGQPGIDFDGGASWNGGVALDDPDPQCLTARHDSEAPSCGLGAELALVVPIAALVAARRRRTRAC